MFERTRKIKKWKSKQKTILKLIVCAASSVMTQHKRLFLFRKTSLMLEPLGEAKTNYLASAERKGNLKKAARKRRQENLRRFSERNDKEQSVEGSPTSALDLSLWGNADGVENPTPPSYIATITARVPSQESPILRW